MGSRPSIVEGGCTGQPIFLPSGSLRIPLPPVSILIGTFVLWFAVSAAYAYMYVSRAIAWPLARGYEREWDWQLFFFALTRVPWLLGLLVGLVAVESVVLARKRGDGAA